MSTSAPKHPSPPLARGPTAERYQHDRIEAPEISERVFRQAWVVRGPLDRLLKAGLISAFEYRMAIEFRVLFERAHRGQIRVRDLVAIRVDGGRYNYGEPGDAQVAALEQLARIRRELGKVAYALVMLVVIEEAKWRTVAKQLGGIDPRTARTWGCAALAGLAALI